MSNIAMVGDLHIGTRTGNSEFLDFQTQWIETFLEQCAQHKVKAIVQAGDFLDVRKQVQGNILHWVLNTFIPMVRKAGIPWYINVGNHDIYYRDSNEIYNTSTLQWYCPQLIHVYNRFTEVEIEDVDFLFIPWLDVQNREQMTDVINQTKAEYAIGHLELSGFPLYKGIVNEHGMEAKPFEKFKKVFTGHYHTVSASKNIQYLGSPYHLTWSDYPDGNERGWWLFDTDTHDYQLMKNESHQTLFSYLEYSDDKKYTEEDLKPYEGNIIKVIVTKKENEANFKKFKKLLDTIKVIDYSIIDKTTTTIQKDAVIDAATLSLDTLSIFSEYIKNQPDLPCDSARLIDLMTKTYTEALTK